MNSALLLVINLGNTDEQTKLSLLKSLYHRA